MLEMPVTINDKGISYAMQVSQAYIERIRQINPTYQHLELAAVDKSLIALKPGQSLLARMVDPNQENEHWEPYLREHWWPVGFTSSGTLLIERPRSITYRPGDYVSILGPIGKPYRFRASLRNVLLVAYNTEPTPLAIMIPLLLHNNISVTLVLLGEARHYQTTHLAPEVEVIRSDDNMQWPDMVMTLGWADQVFIVVGQDDETLRFSEVMALIKERRHDIPKNYLFGISQPVMACGVGACYTCTLVHKNRLSLVCVDGPAFDLTQVKLPT